MTAPQPQQQSIQPQQGKIRYAVVGLGWIAQAAVLPAFAQAQENSKLVALVSDKPAKLQELGQKYGVEQTYNYEDYDRCLRSGKIDAVYLALPNHLHCDYTIRAAEAGVHVLCEKPMALDEAECEAMIHACESQGVKLMIAYRLHLEAANLKAIEIVQSGQLGNPRIFNSVFCQQVETGNIRVRQVVGGGSLDDMGIYCINAARYLFQDEPVEVFATTASVGEQRFTEVAEMTTAILRFPQERLATFTCSFGAAPVSTYQVVGTQGDLRLDPAYAFEGELKHYLTLDGQTQEQTFAAGDQFAAELVYFSNCILQNRDPGPSGLEGLNDIRIIRALEQAIASGRPVRLAPLPRPPRPTPAQAIHRPPTPTPELVHAADPGGQA